MALVAPAGPLRNEDDLARAVDNVRSFGWQPVVGEHALARDGYFAGLDHLRAADLNGALRDDSIDAVWCLRGGYGAMRILDSIDYAAVARRPKPFIGYSDITALHCAIHAKTGLVTFHGPIGAGSWNRFNVDQFRRLFLQRELVQYRNVSDPGDELVQRKNRTVTITGGTARGELVGGNLSVLVALAGSRYLPDFSGRILFLEDVSEAPYRVDRMFSTLRLMGALDRIAGVVFGECTECDPGGGYGSLTLSQILDDYLLPLKIPAYRGAMIGHIRQQFIVPVGGQVEMDAFEDPLEQFALLGGIPRVELRHRHGVSLNPW